MTENDCCGADVTMGAPMEKVTFYIILPHARARRRRSTLICARGGSWGVRPHAADLCDVRVSVEWCLCVERDVCVCVRGGKEKRALT